MNMRGAQLGDSSAPWGSVEFKQWFIAGKSKMALLTWLVTLRGFLWGCAQLKISTCSLTPDLPGKVVSGGVGPFTWWLASPQPSLSWKPGRSCMALSDLALKFTQHHSVVGLESQAGPHSREVSWTPPFDDGMSRSHNWEPCGMRDVVVASLEESWALALPFAGWGT